MKHIQTFLLLTAFLLATLVYAQDIQELPSCDRRVGVTVNSTNHRLGH